MRSCKACNTGNKKFHLNNLKFISINQARSDGGTFLPIATGQYLAALANYIILQTCNKKFYYFISSLILSITKLTLNEQHFGDLILCLSSLYTVSPISSKLHPPCLLQLMQSEDVGNT